MTDEVNDSSPEVTIIDDRAPEVETQEYDAQTLQAMEMGYDPEYKGTADKPAKTAKQFLDDGEKIGLKKQVKEKDLSLKSMELAMQQLVGRQESLEAEIREKVLKELNEKRRSAVEMADAEAYDKYNSEYEQYLDKMKQQTSVPTVTAEDSYHVNSFVDRNKSWFNTDTVHNLKLYNEAIETEKLLRQHKPHLGTDEVLLEVEKYIKDAHSDFFKSNLRTTAPPMVVTNIKGHSHAGGRKPSINDLTEGQKKTIAMCKRSSLDFNVDQYINDLYDNGYIPGFNKRVN